MYMPATSAIDWIKLDRPGNVVPSAPDFSSLYGSREEVLAVFKDS
jgi:hypothetical protein